MSNEQKQAIEYGVPMRETCEQMEWQKETSFAYLIDNIETGRKYDVELFLLSFIDEKEDLIHCFSLDRIVVVKRRFSETKIIYAPQMHEIIPMLPPFANATYQNILQSIVDRISIKVENNHFAQACAELYINLKKEDLLK